MRKVTKKATRVTALEMAHRKARGEITIERLPFKSADDPRYEVRAPKGWRFEVDLHALCCMDLAQAKEERETHGKDLETCPHDCSCQEVDDDA
jgi:hypothetical protein